MVHEVAHQWWYNQVGNDQVRSPWLDEGLAEFSMYEYTLKRYGEPRAERLRQLRWQLPVAVVAQGGNDAPIGRAVVDYEQDYETLVYGKGALFFAELRDELGPATFQKLAADLSGTLPLAHRHARGVPGAGGGGGGEGVGCDVR